ncbi:hypothetical protein F5148DRAFT_1172510 [Russula earlei]|uniref:Uncharacterized protein n=1 Tax=Russula earlei TaxID=71964 RepID=A0ACC0UIP4_9AGAM|nr:hypothetical protein F5148DRAFT_1172510 [Russula earlei]
MAPLRGLMVTTYFVGTFVPLCFSANLWEICNRLKIPKDRIGTSSLPLSIRSSLNLLVMWSTSNSLVERQLRFPILHQGSTAYEVKSASGDVLSVL